MQSTAIIDAAKDYVTTQYQEHPHPELVYHNFVHTQQVVQAAARIAAHYRLQDDELAAVYIAAWFHDIGYLLGAPKEHEEHGADAAIRFLQEHEGTEALQQLVKGCILATKMPQSPTTLIEQIVCDADLFHLGTKEYNDRNKLLRHEVEMASRKGISQTDWLRGNIRFLSEHHYWTDYCQTLLKEQKEENLEKMKKKLEKREAEAATGTESPDTSAEIATAATLPLRKKEKEKKAKKPERGVETMFRITATNHIRLSSMADTKAHIMISVNSIIISFMLSVLIGRLEDYPNMVLPAILFITTSVITVIFAVLATRPNVTSGTFTKDDIANKKANLLFFGNFYKMDMEEYKWGMRQMMEDADYLYGSMTQDVYHLGVVLGRKYKLLRISYNIFMFGLTASVIAFMTAAIFFPAKA